MFTGIIQEIGIVRMIEETRLGRSLTIETISLGHDCLEGDSMSVEGVCLTITKALKRSFSASAVQETLKKTTLSTWKIGQKVNLERPLKMGDPLGGHWVQGHVDAKGKIISIIQKGMENQFEVDIPDVLSGFMVQKGSIAINGVSLTVTDIINHILKISVIPFTFQHTTFQFLRPGHYVNLETDILAKYVQKALQKTGKS